MLREGYCLAGLSGSDAAQQAPLITLLWPWVIIFGIFYLLIFRPQKLKQKELETMISALEKGDKVVTSGGLVGIVAGLKEKTIVVKIADNVKVDVLRGSISHVDKGKP